MAKSSLAAVSEANGRNTCAKSGTDGQTPAAHWLAPLSLPSNTTHFLLRSHSDLCSQKKAHAQSEAGVRRQQTQVRVRGGARVPFSLHYGTERDNRLRWCLKYIHSLTMPLPLVRPSDPLCPERNSGPSALVCMRASRNTVRARVLNDKESTMYSSTVQYTWTLGCGARARGSSERTEESGRAGHRRAAPVGKGAVRAWRYSHAEAKV